MRPAFLPMLALTLVSGCAGTSPPTSFYLLDAEPVASPVAVSPGISLGLGPILLPDTLERPQIVTRQGPYRLELAEFHRWAGDLKANLARLLAARLMSDLGTERVAIYPWQRPLQPDYQIRVDILRFDGGLGGRARLQGGWSLLDGEGRRELHREAFDLEQAVAGTDYQHLVAAMSGLAAALGDRIAVGVVGQAAVSQAGPRP